MHALHEELHLNSANGTGNGISLMERMHSLRICVLSSSINWTFISGLAFLYVWPSCSRSSSTAITQALHYYFFSVTWLAGECWKDSYSNSLWVQSSKKWLQATNFILYFVEKPRWCAASSMFFASIKKKITTNQMYYKDWVVLINQKV